MAVGCSSTIVGVVDITTYFPFAVSIGFELLFFVAVIVIVFFAVGSCLLGIYQLVVASKGNCLGPLSQIAFKTCLEQLCLDLGGLGHALRQWLLVFSAPTVFCCSDSEFNRAPSVAFLGPWLSKLRAK